MAEGRQKNVKFYPLVGLRTPGEVVEANFGKSPFKFAISLYAKDERARLQSAINSSLLVTLPQAPRPTPNSSAYESKVKAGEIKTINQIVLAYTVQQGCYETASRLFYDISGSKLCDAVARSEDSIIDPLLIENGLQDSIPLLKNMENRQSNKIVLVIV